MWGDYNKYEAGFSAGNEISEEDLRKNTEREMDMMGIWDAVGLGRNDIYFTCLLHRTP